ncbi:MAG: CD3324 family protein [Clostridia bacterium]
MKYKNALQVLPERLISELQEYVSGQILYVPEKDGGKAGWGERNGTREKYRTRNREILMLYRGGFSREQIARQYHLSEHSIKKILQQKPEKGKT